MCRVVRDGGMIHIICPDYRGTYEGHYRIAWIPLFPKKLAKLYLKLRGKNPAYLQTLNYTTKPLIESYLHEIKFEQNIDLEIIDLNKKSFEERLVRRNLKFLNRFYFIYYMIIYLKNLFRQELSINLLIQVKKKTDI